METLIYSALLAAGLLVLVTAFQSVIELQSTLSAERQLLRNQQFVEAVIISRLDESGGITTPASGSASQLVISSPVAGEDPVTFDLTDGVLTMTLGSADPVDLTTPQVTVDSFTVARLSGSPASITVKTVLSAISGVGGAITFTSDFTYTLRYE